MISSELKDFEENILPALENTLLQIENIISNKKTYKNKKCEHGKYIKICVDCMGSSICQHKKIRHYCITCKGASICPHNRIKYNCRDCIGSNVCEHDKIKGVCVLCGGIGICHHGRQKKQCIDCMGSGICEHKRRRVYCHDCKGSQICIHDKLKFICKICDGRLLCKTEWCETIAKNKRYNGYCFRCCVNLFPDTPVYRNYKTKENEVVDKVTTTFPNFTWVADKRVLDGRSKRRPDLLLDMGTHIIIIEVDENRHADYDCSCENKRLMELSQDLQHRPIVFIRFNPDGYVDQDGNKIASCWKINNSLGIIQVTKNKRKEWANRIETLIQQIQYWVNNPTQKTIEIIELFY